MLNDGYTQCFRVFACFLSKQRVVFVTKTRDPCFGACELRRGVDDSRGSFIAGRMHYCGRGRIGVSARMQWMAF